MKNRRYLGNKYKLLEDIEKIVEEHTEGIKVVTDLFAGTGVVGEYFLKKGKKVIFNDILGSNNLIYRAWFGEGEFSKKKIEHIIMEFNEANSDDLEDNYVSKNFSDTYFNYLNCKKIGYIRETIEIMYGKKRINEREKSILISSLIYAMDKIANTVGHYDAYISSTAAKEGLNRKLVLCFPNVISARNKVEIYKKDANDLVKEIRSDLVYIDPPYNSRQYSDMYHFLENIVEWKKEAVYYKAKKINRSHIKSLYSQKEAERAFSDLIADIDAKYILVSYNNTGIKGASRSQAKISDAVLVGVLEKRGKVKIIEKEYATFTTGKSQITNTVERFFLCEVGNKGKKEMVEKKEISGEIIKSSLNYTGGKYRMIGTLKKVFPANIGDATFIDVFAGGANVLLNSGAKKVVCNDLNKHVISIYKLFEKESIDWIIQQIENIIDEYNLTDSYRNGYEYYGCNSDKGLGRVNKESYSRLKEKYNEMRESKRKTIIFLVLIMYSFNNQIRFNASGKYNMPIGKRDFNKANRGNLMKMVERLQLLDIEFLAVDFRKIDIEKYNNPIVYCDPPYSLTTATYTENGRWTERDDEALFTFLDRLNEKSIPFILSNVLEHSNKRNEKLLEWILRNKYNILHVNHTYANSSYQKKEENRRSISDEVIVTNYIK